MSFTKLDQRCDHVIALSGGVRKRRAGSLVMRLRFSSSVFAIQVLDERVTEDRYYRQFAARSPVMYQFVTTPLLRSQITGTGNAKHS